YPWSTSLKDGTPYTSGSSIDVQTVLTHEMGHTLGLGDVYGTKYASDSSEIMNAYSKVKDELGNGDKTGIWTLYH
ncbi:MAG: matrixin family metalloprotease, partial [Methanotrichaceae archaeon]